MCQIIYQFFGELGSWLGNTINIILGNPIWKTYSSYNLGVAITAIAIVVTFIEFISNRQELRFSLNYGKRRIALWLACGSVILVFFGELNGLFTGYPFIFEISGAILIIVSIAIYLHVILNPIKQLKPKQILILQDILAGTLSNSQLNESQTIKGCIGL